MTRLVTCLVLLALAVSPAAFAAAANLEGVTFHRDVQPILQQECQICHRPNGANLGGMVAPMALTTYDEARPWAKSIAKQAEARTMPPWHASAEQSGVFANERTLTDVEIETLVTWAKAGAPAGDIADAPQSVEWASDGGWLIGEPDLILTPDEPYFVEDEVYDHYVSLRTTMTDEILSEDRYVKAIEFRPGSSVVHHIIVPSLGGIAPGNDPTIHRDGIGSVLRAGRDLRWQMHYHKEPGEGTGAWDQSQVAIKFYEEGETPEFELQNADLGRFDFELPAGQSDYSIQTEFVFPTDSLIVGYLPHMHLRGKSAKYEAVYPDGTTEVLLEVPRYDFNWQTTYKYRNYKEVPEGTKVIFTSAWDNSVDNPYNPDPDTVVRWGEPTTDEMSFGFMSFINEANEGADLFGNGVFDITAVVAFTDKSRDGKMQLEEAPEQVKSFFQMMDQNKDGGIDMSEARAATEFLARQAEAKEAEASAESDAPASDAGF